MNNSDELVLQLQQEIVRLTNELNETKEHLKKYTAPERSKIYYQNHKEEIQQKKKANPISPEKRKEYNKQYYLKKIEKQKDLE
jgi:hypothetical protein